MDPVARLGKKPFASAKSSDAPGRGGALQKQFKACSDGIPITLFAIAGKFEGNKPVARGGVVLKAAKSGSAAINDPDIKVAIKIPVGGSQTSAIIGKAETSQGGNVGKAGLLASPDVEESAVPFAATESAVLMEQPAQGAPALQIFFRALGREVVDW